MPQEVPVFKEIYEEYLKKVADIDFADKAEKLGIHVHGKKGGIPHIPTEQFHGNIQVA